MYPKRTLKKRHRLGRDPLRCESLRSSAARGAASHQASLNQSQALVASVGAHPTSAASRTRPRGSCGWKGLCAGLGIAARLPRRPAEPLSRLLAAFPSDQTARCAVAHDSCTASDCAWLAISGHFLSHPSIMTFPSRHLAHQVTTRGGMLQTLRMLRACPQG